MANTGISRNAIQKAVPLIKEFGVSPEAVQKEIAFALNTINTNSKLKNCTQDSILSCIIQAANLGITLNKEAQECALIPRGNQCTLMPMYQGIANIAFRNGNIVQLITKPVHEKDTFEIRETDTEDPITHSRGFGDRGKIIGFYTIIVFKDGRKQAETMSVDEVEKVRSMSSAGNSGPWKQWYSEMGRKACLKRALKYVNTNRSNDLVKVIELDNEEYTASTGQVKKIEYMLSNCTLDDEEKHQIEEALFTMSSNEASDTIQMLEAHMLPDHPGWNDRVNKTTVGKQVKAQVENKKS